LKVLITGVSQGLGYHLAKELLNKHHEVIGISRSQITESKNLQMLQSHSNFNYCQTHLSDRKELQNRIMELISSGMIPDMVILNAASMDNDCKDNFDFEKFSNIIEINLLSSLFIVELLLPVFKKRDKGVFVAISSLSAMSAFSRRKVGVGYPASKSALSMAFESLRLYCSSSNIRFITIQPGMLSYKDTFLNTSYARAANKILTHVFKNNSKQVFSFPLIHTVIMLIAKIVPHSILKKLLS
jgi:3-oxoacyl-[acyl-carrier protein] reductase